MKLSKIYLVLLTLSVALILQSCDSVTDNTAQNEIQSQGLAIDGDARKAKVDVCHYDAELDEYKLINISNNAVKAHEKHGDAKPGEEVPTREGFVFDETCTPVSPVVEISACFTDALNILLPFISVDELVFEDFEWTLIQDIPSSLTIQSSTQINGGSISLSTFTGSGNKCIINYPTSATSSIGTSGFIDDFEESKSYLRYLLSL